MPDQSDFFTLPDGLQSSPDPVEGNPFPNGDLRHKVWNDATLTAEEELHRFNAELLQERNTDPKAHLNWTLRLVTGKYDIWAKRGIHVVWSDSEVSAYDQWLFNYAQEWLRSLSEKHSASFLIEARALLISRMEYWKAEARRYLAAQKAHASSSESADTVRQWMKRKYLRALEGVRSRIRRILRTLSQFWVRHWKWIITTLLAALGLYFASRN